MKDLRILITILVFQTCLFAQPPRWRIAEGTAGIFIADIDIYFSDPDTMYAVGDKFLLSVNKGERWVGILGSAAGSSVLKVDPFNSKIIYVSHSHSPAFGNDVSMTTDGGTTWRHLFMGRQFPASVIEIDPVDLKTVYVGVGPSSIYRSLDQGLTWDRLPLVSGGIFTSLAISSSDNGIFYAGFDSGIFKSTDRGNTWIELSGLQKYGVTVLAVHPHNPGIVYAGLRFSGGVYKSIDGGVSWVEKNNGLSADGSRDINAILINPKNPNEIFIGASGNIFFRSTDGGENWTEFNDGLPHSGHIISMVMDTLNNRLYAGHNTGIYIYDGLGLPEIFMLYQNYPNPFNAKTIIPYSLPEEGFIKLAVYNLLGKEVRTLVEEFKSKGIDKVNFDAKSLPSGLYFYRLTAGKRSHVRKAMLVK